MEMKYIPLGLLSAFVTKLLVLGTNLSEMGVVFSLVALSAVYEYVDRHKKMRQVEESSTKQIEEIRAIVKKQNEAIELMATKLAEHRTEVSSIKLASSMTQKRFGA